MSQRLRHPPVITGQGSTGVSELRLPGADQEQTDAAKQPEQDPERSQDPATASSELSTRWRGLSRFKRGMVLRQSNRMRSMKRTLGRRQHCPRGKHQKQQRGRENQIRADPRRKAQQGRRMRQVLEQRRHHGRRVVSTLVEPGGARFHPPGLRCNLRTKPAESRDVVSNSRIR